MKKILGRKSYGSIGHMYGSKLGRGDHCINEGMMRIATVRPRDKHDLVIVNEKLDGSNVGIAKVNGNVYPLTRSGHLASTSPYLQHYLFAQWVDRNPDRWIFMLDEGERICGEWLVQAHGTRYNMPHEPFVAFDIMTEGKRLGHWKFMDRCLEYGVTTPRLLHIGTSIRIEDIESSLERGKSTHGAIDAIEGAVWRIERKGEVDFLCKYVRPDHQTGRYLPGINPDMHEPLWNRFAGADWLVDFIAEV